MRPHPCPSAAISRALALLALGLASAASARELWDWQQLADGVWAATQPRAARFDDSNSVVVVTEQEILVIDAQEDAARVEALFDLARTVSDLPVAWLINTHWHIDHVGGNAHWKRLAPEIQILAHESVATTGIARARELVRDDLERLEEQIPLAEEALERGQGLAGQDLDEEQQQAQAAAIEGAKGRLEGLRASRLVGPDVTYDGRFVLHRGAQPIELLSFAGHTAGDTVVWLPEPRVLITGDLFDELPFGGHGYPQSWLAALRELRALEPRVIVPGHGAVQRDLEGLDLAIELWSTLIEELRLHHARGLSLEQARVRLDLGTLEERFCGDDEVARRNWNGFMPRNVERVWQELAGELDA